jgi:hypothetical protein
MTIEELMNREEFESSKQYLSYLRSQHLKYRKIDDRYKTPKIVGMGTGIILFLAGSISIAYNLSDINIDFSLTKEQISTKYEHMGLAALSVLTGLGIGLYSYYFPPSRRVLRHLKDIDDKIAYEREIENR